MRPPGIGFFSQGGAWVDERDEIVEVARSTVVERPVGERHHPQPPVGVLGRAGEEELVESLLACAPVREALDDLGALFETHGAPGERRPVALLLVVEVLRVYPLPLACDDGEAPSHVGSDGDEPRRRRQPAAGVPPEAVARRRSHPGALAVEVRVEQRVQGDHAIGVGRGPWVHEVDDDAGLLARMHHA